MPKTSTPAKRPKNSTYIKGGIDLSYENDLLRDALDVRRILLRMIEVEKAIVKHDNDLNTKSGLEFLNEVHELFEIWNKGIPDRNRWTITPKLDALVYHLIQRLKKRIKTKTRRK